MPAKVGIKSYRHVGGCVLFVHGLVSDSCLLDGYLATCFFTFIAIPTHFLNSKFIFYFWYNLKIVILFAVRLVNGPTQYEGRVEVYHNGEWGTVCNHGWDLKDAQVVCKQLDLGNAAAARYNAFYGEGSGQIWLQDLRCLGNESTIGDCPHDGWGYTSFCDHYEDVGIKCDGGNN